MREPPVTSAAFRLGMAALLDARRYSDEKNRLRPCPV